MYNILNDPERFEDAFRDLLKEKKFVTETGYCEVGIDNTCDINEVCIPQHTKSRAGIITILLN